MQPGKIDLRGIGLNHEGRAMSVQIGGASALPQAADGRRLSSADHAVISVLWLALYAQWLSIMPIVLPDQVAGIVGTDNPDTAGIVGSIAAAGAAVALLVAPIAGALSDRSRSPRGRRRPLLISGMILSSIALVPLALLARGSNILLYGAAILNLQLWWNWAAGAYAGLVPDVVPPEQQARTSGWLNVMTIVGTILGNGLVWALYRPGRVWALIGAFAALNLAALALTLCRVREPVPRGISKPFDWRTFVTAFFLDPRSNANLYWVLLTRLLANMGIWSVFTFLLFYLQSVVGLSRDAAVNVLPALLGAGTLAAIPASLAGVRLAERYGIVRLVRISSWIMAGAVACFALVAMHPNLWVVALLALVFGAANGAYGAVDWALALKVLPAAQNAGKDMGIWHVSMVLPQIIGPAVMGWLITAIEHHGSARLAYAAAFAVAALWFTVAAHLVKKVRPTAGGK